MNKCKTGDCSYSGRYGSYVAVPLTAAEPVWFIFKIAHPLPRPPSPCMLLHPHTDGAERLPPLLELDSPQTVGQEQCCCIHSA